MAGDTRDDVRRILVDRIRRQSPAERVEAGAKLMRSTREVMRAGIQARHPDYRADQVEDALARLLWGDELYRRVYPGRELPAP